MEKTLKEFFKVKNTKFVGTFIVTGYRVHQDDFVVSIKKGDQLMVIGAFAKGLSPEEKESLHNTIKNNQVSSNEEIISIKAGICAELTFEAISENRLVKPIFQSFQLKQDWQKCTIEALLTENLANGYGVTLTSLEKQYWETVTKEDYISYLLSISPYMLPFLKNKNLTVIRFPDGIEEESFYQKNCPDYAPEFIQTNRNDDIDYIICNDLTTLIWLGNQGALEFHIPFNTKDTRKPNEIIFDLDPPDEESFQLVILAAREINNLLTSMSVRSFPKLTGSKGLQIHIPIHHLNVTYEDTRLFTSSIANHLVKKHPTAFTIERMRRNRNGRLYVDYLQHAEGKTMISPYSTRGKRIPTVAAPLFWEEVTDTLSPSSFTIQAVLDRIENNKCPFIEYFNTKNDSLFQIIDQLKKNEKAT